MAHILYIIFKILGYSLYCGVLNKFIIEKYSPMKIFKIGVFRALLGAFFGVLVFLGLLVFSGQSNLPVPLIHENNWSAYLSIYVPIRILEWGIILFIFFNKKELGLKRKILWVLGGIALSILIDVVFAPNGLKVGRIFC